MESVSICCRLRLLSYIIPITAKNINTIGVSDFLQHNNQRKRPVTAGIIGAAQIFVRAPHDILKSQPMPVGILFSALKSPILRNAHRSVKAIFDFNQEHVILTVGGDADKPFGLRVRPAQHFAGFQRIIQGIVQNDA